MGINKRMFQEERQSKFNRNNTIKHFKDADTIYIDVRVSFTIPKQNVADVPVKWVKKDIRKRMLSDFRKQLTKTLNEQL